MGISAEEIPSWPYADSRELELLTEVVASPQWGGFHPFVSRFEKAFAEYQHAQFGIGAFNGTVTLELALSVLGIGLGDEVIVPAISFVSTAMAVSRAGAIPVFVDIEEDTYNLNPAQVRAAITSKTKAVMAVHFGGVPCDLDALEAICRDGNLLLMEDAAHAHGSEWRGRRAGSFGVAGSFSFQNGKVLSSGEGGLLATSDGAFAETARSLVNCGREAGDSFYRHHRVGTNFRMTGLQAAVLLAQLERLPEQITKRTKNARLLKRLLSDVPELIWQQEPEAMTQCSWYLLIGRVKSNAVSRDAFVRRLAESGVPCTPFYPHTLYQNPVFSRTECRVLPCPEAESRVADGFWLPHRVLLAEEETIVRIAETIKESLARPWAGGSAV